MSRQAVALFDNLSSLLKRLYPSN